MLFNINYQLCKTYKALSPFDVDAHKYHDIIMLYAETKRVIMEEEKEANRKPKQERRPAGDNWF